MTLNIEWMDWMPSPPLAPGTDAIDVAHLERMTLGERDLRQEVLSMFLQQSEVLARRLADEPDRRAAITHTLKGAATAIGAFAVAEAAEAVERGLGTEQAIDRQMIALHDALDAAQVEIRGLLLKH